MSCGLRRGRSPSGRSRAERSSGRAFRGRCRWNCSSTQNTYVFQPTVPGPRCGADSARSDNDVPQPPSPRTCGNAVIGLEMITERGQRSHLDLITPGVAASTAFHTGLFGWQAHLDTAPEAPGYTMLTLDGDPARPVAALTSHPDGIPAGTPSIWTVFDRDAVPPPVASPPRCAPAMPPHGVGVAPYGGRPEYAIKGSPTSFVAG